MLQLLLLTTITTTLAFTITTSSIPRIIPKSSSALWDGVGVAKDYEWLEDFQEMEIRVKVPKETRSKHIHFKTKPFSIDLSYSLDNGNTQRVLLDPTRKLRGQVAIDGTFWNFGDEDSDERTVVVTIEKNIRPPRDDFDIIDYDWGGVYMNETDGEVLSKNYTGLEEMDIREYAGRMGVDINNINMSNVDKTMFSSGLTNFNQSTLERLKKRGLVSEQDSQGDGTTDEDGKPIPFLDTKSEWETDKPSYNMTELEKEYHELQEAKNEYNKKKKKVNADKSSMSVTELKHMLRIKGLKVSGTKKELVQRLVQSSRISPQEEAEIASKFAVVSTDDDDDDEEESIDDDDDDAPEYSFEEDLAAEETDDDNKEEHFQNKDAKDLHNLLRLKGLETTGSKDELVQRLVQSSQLSSEDEAQIASNFVAKTTGKIQEEGNNNHDSSEVIDVTSVEDVPDITPASNRISENELNQFTVPMLKQILRQRGLKVSGTKEILVQRLLTAPSTTKT